MSTYLTGVPLRETKTPPFNLLELATLLSQVGEIIKTLLLQSGSFPSVFVCVCVLDDTKANSGRLAGGQVVSLPWLSFLKVTFILVLITSLYHMHPQGTHTCTDTNSTEKNPSTHTLSKCKRCRQWHGAISAIY